MLVAAKKKTVPLLAIEQEAMQVPDPVGVVSTWRRNVGIDLTGESSDLANHNQEGTQ